MKQQNMLMTGAAALVALAAVGAIAASSYAASTTDTTATDTRPAQGMMRGRWENLTDAQKAELEVQRTERQATMEVDRDAINTAMAQGYGAWVAAVKQYHGESAPMLEEVTADNFAKFAEAHGHMNQARTIFEEIGIDRPGMGMGMGKGGHGGRGMGMGGGCDWDADDVSATDTQ